MRILIADDMEGITGVVNWDQVELAHAEYTRFRRIMTGDVNAAVRGAFAGGADEVVISDGHDDGNNLLIEELDPRARLNTGSPSSLSMMQGVDGADAVLLVGYHARAGTHNAVLCHTWSQKIANVWLNGRVIGEIGLNASLAGAFGVPALMISGCRATCVEAGEWIEDIEPVVVKTASGMFAAECLPPAQTQRMISEAAERAVKRFKAGQGPKPLVTAAPVVLRVMFNAPSMADKAALVPDVTRIDGRTVELSAPDMPAAYRGFRALASLGR